MKGLSFFTLLLFLGPLLMGQEVSNVVGDNSAIVPDNLIFSDQRPEREADLFIVETLIQAGDTNALIALGAAGPELAKAVKYAVEQQVFQNELDYYSQYDLDKNPDAPPILPDTHLQDIPESMNGLRFLYQDLVMQEDRRLWKAEGGTFDNSGDAHPTHPKLQGKSATLASHSIENLSFMPPKHRYDMSNYAKEMQAFKKRKADYIIKTFGSLDSYFQLEEQKLREQAATMGWSEEGLQITLESYKTDWSSLEKALKDDQGVAELVDADGPQLSESSKKNLLIEEEKKAFKRISDFRVNYEGSLFPPSFSPSPEKEVVLSLLTFPKTMGVENLTVLLDVNTKVKNAHAFKWSLRSRALQRNSFNELFETFAGGHFSNLSVIKESLHTIHFQAGLETVVTAMLNLMNGIDASTFLTRSSCQAFKAVFELMQENDALFNRYKKLEEKINTWKSSPETRPENFEIMRETFREVFYIMEKMAKNDKEIADFFTRRRLSFSPQ